MPDPIPPATPPANTPPAPDISGLQSTLDGLTKSLDEIAERIETVEQQVTAPPKPPTPPQGDEWKPSKWSDIPKKSEEIAEQIVDKKLAEKEEEAQAVKDAETAKQKAIDDEFDKQLSDLETSGGIPKVQDPSNDNDPGRVARREVFGLGVHYDSPNLTKMAELRAEFAKRGLRYDPKTDKLLRVEGAPTYSQNAPVGGVNKAGGSESKPTYKDIHFKSVDQLRREFEEA